MAQTTQDRVIKLKTALPDDTFIAIGFSGIEAISALYSFDISLISENHRINFHDVLGSNASLIVEIEREKVIVFNGIISRFTQGSGGGEQGSDARYSYYTATLVPKLWLATQTKKMRKWLDKSSSEVVQDILSEHALSGDIARTDFQHDYVLQYNESDFNVIARLLEEEDTYFYFEQNESGFEHRLVTVKPPGNPSEIGTARYVVSESGVDEGDLILSLSVSEEIKTNLVGLADHVPKETVDTVAGMDSTEMFPSMLGVKEYPGDIESQSRGDLKAKIRLGTDQANRIVLAGSSNCMFFRSGKPFKLTNYYRSEMNNQKYLLTAVHHECQQDLSGVFTYSNSFSCIPANVLYRPPRTAYRPQVSGIQTAIVTEEPNPEGWIKVKVPWDGTEDLEHPRARVCQPWAGEGFGGWFVPKVDHEVVLDFVDSDPRKPVVTGRVYNLNKQPPYGHDAHLKTTIRSAKEHELTFDDEDSNERVYRYSHKNEDVLVEEKMRETVGKDRHMLTRGNLYEEMQERNTSVKLDSKEKVDMSRSLQVGMNNDTKVGMNYALESGMAIHIKGGMTVVVEAGMQLTLKVGGNFIDINPGGIFIQGTMVMINSGGAAGSGAGSSPASPTGPEQVTRPTGGGGGGGSSSQSSSPQAQQAGGPRSSSPQRQGATAQQAQSSAPQSSGAEQQATPQPSAAGQGAAAQPSGPGQGAAAQQAGGPQSSPAAQGAAAPQQSPSGQPQAAPAGPQGSAAQQSSAPQSSGAEQQATPQPSAATPQSSPAGQGAGAPASNPDE